jgi:hypothetical protein
LSERLIYDEDFAKGQEAWDSVCEDGGDPFQEDWRTAIDMAMSSNMNSNIVTVFFEIKNILLLLAHFV